MAGRAPYCVVVVDPDGREAAALTAALAGLGAVVLPAPTAEAAIDKARFRGDAEAILVCTPVDAWIARDLGASAVCLAPAAKPLAATLRERAATEPERRIARLEGLF